MLRPAVSQFDLGAHGRQQLACGFNVAYLRNVFQNDRFFREQGGGHGWQGGVLGSADPNCSQQRIAAADYKFVHWLAYCNGDGGEEWAGNCYSGGHGLWDSMWAPGCPACARVGETPTR